MNPQPSDLLPPQTVQAAMARNSNANGLFNQSPMSAGLTPDAMASDPSLQSPTPPGAPPQNPMMPPQDNQQGQLAGQPAPLDESQMILQALTDRLKHHSSVNLKTIGTITKMIESQLPQDPTQNPPTA